MTPAVKVLLLAAGRGERSGAEENKVFLPIAGKSALVRSAEAFLSLPEVAGLVVIHARGEETRAMELLNPLDRRLLGFVLGGKTRAESVQRGLRFLNHQQHSQKKPVHVLIHDAARCFVDSDLIRRVLTAMRNEHVGAAPTLAVGDTVRRLERGRILETPPRRELFAMQTPQGGELSLLKTAYDLALQAGVELTDDMAALERIGCPIRFVEGSPLNLKITTPFDLRLAEFLAAEKEASLAKAADRENVG